MPTSSPAPTGYQLNGLLERVTFFSEETGFCVLRVKADGQRDLVTVVGSVASVSAGEWITVEGDWVIDKEHGRQLKVFHLKTMPPNTREGMEKYLASLGEFFCSVAHQHPHLFGLNIFCEIWASSLPYRYRGAFMNTQRAP
jgi:hypothetical protein